MQNNKNIKLTFIPALIIVIAGIIVYSNTLGCGFYFDDGFNIVENFYIKKFFHPSLIWQYNPSRFVTYYTLSFNYMLGGLNAAGYHVVNIIIHITTALLIYVLAKKTIRLAYKEATDRFTETASLFAGLLFAVHPVQTQAVTYIIQRAASLATMFYLASLITYVNYRTDSEPNKQKVYYGFSLLFCLLAMFSKEIAFTLPFTIAIYEFYFLRRQGKYKLGSLVPYFLFLAIIPLTILISSPGAVKEASQASSKISPISYLFTQFSVIVTYIRLLIAPVNQNLDYDFPVTTTLFDPYTLLCFVLLIALFIAGILLYKKARMLSFGIIWFFVTLSVESSILPIKDVIFEHRLYLPMAGVTLAFAYYAAKLLYHKNKYVYYFAASAVVIILAAAAYNRNTVWQSELSLWTDVVKKSPAKARGYANRGVAYLNLKRYDEAISDFNKTLTLSKDFKNAYFNRGSAYYYKGNYQNALADFGKTIRLDSSFVKAYNNMGAIYLKLNDFPTAVSYFDTAIKIDTNFAPAYSNRGVAAKAMNDFNKALFYYKKGIEKDPDYYECYYNIGEIMMLQGKLQDAEKYFSKAITLKKDYTEAYYKRGNVYFMTGMLKNSLDDYNSAIKLKMNSADVYNNRGSVYFMSGLYAEALENYTHAIKLNCNLFDAVKNRGITLFILNDPEKAIEDFNHAGQLKKDAAEVYFYRGKCLLMQGNKRLANADAEALRRLGYKADESLLQKANSLTDLKPVQEN